MIDEQGQYLSMNFYQQKYFKPYRKIASELYSRPPPTSYGQSYAQQQDRYNSPHKTGDYTRAPAFERSPSKYIVHTRTAPEPIWQHLYNEGVRSQKQLIQKHNNNKNRIDVECTFQPMLRQNKRYLIHSSSNFLDRVNLWHEQKIQKMVKEKQEEVNKDLKECTFAPRINNKSRSGKIEPNGHSALRLDKSQHKLKQRNRNINPYYSPIKQVVKTGRSISPVPTKQAAPTIQMTTARQLIKTQLRKLAL